ncbi:unnamed protein product [Clavelina lepadiformis]|uniref:Uncharacterized protein n=1 Tax=Clavelina lepadiformis TaxID=159417 RepID=A0ABP0GSM0_CLALP
MEITEHLKEMINVNILALCIATREAITLMKNTNVDDGHIVNINGNAGTRSVLRHFIRLQNMLLQRSRRVYDKSYVLQIAAFVQLLFRLA